MMANNLKERLVLQMQKYKGPDWSPPSDDLHIFSILTTTLFCYDPIGIKNALKFNFSIEDIYDEYDIEAAALLRCMAQWTDAPFLGRSIKEVLDYYLDDDHPWDDCLFLAEHIIPALNDEGAPLDLDAINKLAASRRKEPILIEIE